MGKVGYFVGIKDGISTIPLLDGNLLVVTLTRGKVYPVSLTELASDKIMLTFTDNTQEKKQVLLSEIAESESLFYISKLPLSISALLALM